jgi:UDP-glucose 4-epimerase
MKCLVTGASGFLGKHLTNFLGLNDVEVVAAARSSTSKSVIATGDMNHFTGWASLLEGVEVVIHSAAKAHDTSKSPDLKEHYTEANLKLTLLLASKAKAAGVKRFIFISTIKVNGENTNSNPFYADDIPGPTDDYGISKAQAEAELMKMHHPGAFEIVIIRPCLVYGPGVKANFKNLMDLVSQGWPLPFASIQNRRSFVSIENLSDLILLCMKHPNAAGQIFLVSDDHDLSLPELIKAIANSMNKFIILLPVPLWLFRFVFRLIGKTDLTQRLFGNLQVDIVKTKQILGWKPPVTMQQSLQNMQKQSKGI